MNKIIFDLDGTLWETGNAYIYSYQKTCRQLNIPEDKIQNDDYVRSYLGVKLEDLVQTIIPEAADKMQLGKLLLGNAVEYLLNNPETCSKNIFELFSKLSENYELYILSNCPKSFLDAFYKVSGVKQFITQENTIESSGKSDALKKITCNYSQPAVFVGDSSSDYEAIENHYAIQFIYASYGYGNCSDYNSFLEKLDDLPELLEKLKPMYEILKRNEFQLISCRKSYAALIQKESCCYFGFINSDCPDDFDFIIPKLKMLCGQKKLYGPINGNSWYDYRIALNEFNFRLYPDCLSNELLLKKFLDNNFTVYEEYTSTLSKVNFEKWSKFKTDRISSDYEWKIVKGKECLDYLETIYEISCSCFSEHKFYEPVEFDEFKKLYLNLLSHCSPILILIIYKGKTVAFNFCYPDLENRFFVDKTIAVEKKHRNPMTLFKIIELTHNEIKQLGFDEILMHYQNVNLKTMQSYSRGTIVNQKKYGVLKYENSK